MMFKVLVLQALYNLSDDQVASIINDRLSFMRVLGLGLGDAVPDAKTIWLFREPLPQARAVDNPFTRFDRPLTKAGYLAMAVRSVLPPLWQHRSNATRMVRRRISRLTRSPMTGGLNRRSWPRKTALYAGR